MRRNIVFVLYISSLLVLYQTKQKLFVIVVMKIQVSRVDVYLILTLQQELK